MAVAVAVAVAVKSVNIGFVRDIRVPALQFSNYESTERTATAVLAFSARGKLCRTFSVSFGDPRCFIK